MHDKSTGPAETASTPSPGQDEPSSAPRVGKRSGFRTRVGYQAVLWEEGHAIMELALVEGHMNSNGSAHGGVTMTIADAAMGHAATWCPVSGNVRYCATISLNTSFLQGPREGDVIRAEARLVSVDNRVATCEAEVRDQSGTVLAVAQGSFRYARGSEHLDGVARVTRR